MQPLGRALEEFVKKLGLERKIRQYDAVLQWNEVVGEKVARVSEAYAIRKGVLFVRVSNGPWRNELQVLKGEIITKLNTTLGEEIVHDIRFV
jgi:predicted nucleic acid-binding Zn ribbon protein